MNAEIANQFRHLFITFDKLESWLFRDATCRAYGYKEALSGPEVTNLVEALEKVKEWASIEINGKKLNLRFVVEALKTYREAVR